MSQDDPGLGALPAPGEPVFYPKVGHCIYRGVTEDRAAPGKKLVELEDLEEGSRILIPTERVPKLRLRPAGRSIEEIQEELSSEFEQFPEEGAELDIEALVDDGSPRSLAKGLKRLHLVRQTTGLSREDEQTRRKIRSWLAAEVAISKDCTRAEAQALITRILQEAMNAHRRKEREVAKERRRQVKAQKAAEDAALKQAEDAETEAMRQALFAETERDQPSSDASGEAAREGAGESTAAPDETGGAVEADRAELTSPAAEAGATASEQPETATDETSSLDTEAATEASPAERTKEPAGREANEEDLKEHAGSPSPEEEPKPERTEGAAEPTFEETSEGSPEEPSDDSQPGDPNRAESS